MRFPPKREDPRFSKIYLSSSISPRSFRRLARSGIVVDPSGNENRFDFTHVETNRGLSEKDFDESLPKGTQIIKTGG